MMGPTGGGAPEETQAIAAAFAWLEAASDPKRTKAALRELAAARECVLTARKEAKAEGEATWKALRAERDELAAMDEALRGREGAVTEAEAALAEKWAELGTTEAEIEKKLREAEEINAEAAEMRAAARDGLAKINRTLGGL